jgi:transcriptional antiterminator NusG
MARVLQTSGEVSPEVRAGRLEAPTPALSKHIRDWFGEELRRTKGGEALPETATSTTAYPSCVPSWHVLWTRSNCEQRVYDQVTAKGLEVFLPRIAVWSRRGGERHLAQVPMFPGYLFLHHAMNKESYLEVRKAIGLVSILGERWDRLAAVPDAEIEAIQRTLAARHRVFPHPYLREGQRVRIARGPLADVEGVLVRDNANKGLLVISIEMLRRSVAVELDCTLVAAA